MRTQPTRAVIFDRDGTLNIDTGYIRDPARFRLFDGVPELLAELRAKGYSLFVISNQSGIGRGLINPDEYRAVNRRFLELCGHGVIDEVVYCPHDPARDCACRKPKTALIEVLAERRAIDFARSFFVGDRLSDIACGKNAGMKTIFITHNAPMAAEVKETVPDYLVNSITEIRSIIP